MQEPDAKVALAPAAENKLLLQQNLTLDPTIEYETNDLLHIHDENSNLNNAIQNASRATEFLHNYKRTLDKRIQQTVPSNHTSLSKLTNYD